MRPARSECWGAGLSLAGPGRCLQITNERDSGGGGASDWSRAIMWPASWSLIGREEEEPGICACALAHCLVLIAARPLSLTSPANEDTSPGQPQPSRQLAQIAQTPGLQILTPSYFQNLHRSDGRYWWNPTKSRVQVDSRYWNPHSTLHSLTRYFKYGYIQFYLNARLKCWLIKHSSRWNEILSMLNQCQDLITFLRRISFRLW